MPDSESKKESREDLKRIPLPGSEFVCPSSQIGKPEDSEMLLRKSFEADTNRGIELLFHW